jgi:membrane protein
MTIEKLWVLVRRAWQEAGRDNCSQMAAAIAYRVLFAIVPLTMLVISVLGILAGSEQRRADLVEETTDYLRLTGSAIELSLSAQGRETLTAELGADAVAEIEGSLAALDQEQARQLADELSQSDSVTVAGYELTAADLEVNSDNLIVETLRGVVDASGPVGVLSLILLAYSASGLFATLRRSLDFVWDMPQPRPLFQAKLMDLVMLMGALTTLMLALVAITVGGAIRQVGQSHEDWLGGLAGAGPLWTLASVAFSWLVSFVICLLAFRFVPQTSTAFRDVWLGAVLAATGFEVLKFGFTIYVDNFDSFDVVYGALGGVLLTLLFVYWASYLFLLSAEIAVEYPRVRRGDYEAPRPDEQRTFLQQVRHALTGLFIRGDASKAKDRDNR